VQKKIRTKKEEQKKEKKERAKKKEVKKEFRSACILLSPLAELYCCLLDQVQDEVRLAT
jgi:hypothetical protein